MTRATQDGSDDDLRLGELAARLTELGIERAPTVRLGGEIHTGEVAISHALAAVDALYDPC